MSERSLSLSIAIFLEVLRPGTRTTSSPDDISSTGILEGESDSGLIISSKNGSGFRTSAFYLSEV